MSIESAKIVLQAEADAILDIQGRLGEEFQKAEDLIMATRGRVVVSGLGKSGLVARKISATLSSIGVASFFLHPVEAGHGDMGMVTRGDTAILLSKSGKTDELTLMLDHFKRLDVPIITIVGTTQSPLAGAADIVLDASVKREACTINTIPTASTTAALALGDALAVCIFERRGLTEEDFAMLHPGGSIGKRLTTFVRDVMVEGDDLPIVDNASSMRHVLDVMTEKNLGIAIVTKKGKLFGVITDGGLRRILLRVERPLEISAGDAVAKSTRDMEKPPHPLTVDKDAFAAHAVNIMEKHVVTALVVTDDDERPIGLIRWIELSLAGIV